MLKKEEYQRLKAKDMEKAIAITNAIRDSKDPFVANRDMRPIMDIKHMLETSAEEYKDLTAFMVKDSKGGPYRHIKYSEMFADVNALGTALIERGLKDTRISIIGENSHKWAISYLASVCGTGITVPLDKELLANELKQLIIEAEVTCVIFSGKYKDLFVEMKKSGDTKLSVLINMDSEEDAFEVDSWDALLAAGRRLVEEGNRTFIDAQITRDEMSVILFTSGTTGFSKGVMLSHGNLTSDMMLSPSVLTVRKTDRFFSVLPMHHTYECTCGLLIPLYRGASIAYCEGLKYIAKNLEEASPTIFLGVPALFESLYKKIWQNVRKKGKEGTLRKMIALNRMTKKIGIDLGPLFLKEITAVFGGRLRVMICGGAAINPEVLQGLRDFGINALQGYGLTESSPICALNPEGAPKDSSAGRAIPQTKVKIVDPDPETGIGEICISGAIIMLGYYNNPEATAEVLKDGWYYTGDLGRMDDEGYIYITGRKKNVIITKNGKNVYPEELEYYLRNVPYIAECMVWGKDTGDGEDILIVASIVIDPDEVAAKLGGNHSDEEVLDLLWSEVDKINEGTSPFKRIKKIILRKEEFEKNTSKKIKRFIEANRED